MRFSALATSMTTVGSVGPFGMRDLNPQDKRIMLQFAANSPFSARLYATLDYDFTTNSAGVWFDVTRRARRTDDFAAQADWELVGGKYQRIAKKNADDPIADAGIYAFDPDFFPAAVMINVTSITSGDVMRVHFGV